MKMPVLTIGTLAKALAALVAIMALSVVSLALSVRPSYPAERLAVVSETKDALSETLSFSVMTYNIEGLPWPARSGRADKLEGIRTELKRLETTGELPDLVLFQEAFSEEALEMAAASPFKSFALGPKRATLGSEIAKKHQGEIEREWSRGEWGIKILGSGLAVASRYPLSKIAEETYGTRACAGWDCLSNKGVVLLSVDIPGLRTPLEVATTHMNSKGSSGVSREKQTAAHGLQSLILADFLNRYSRPESPLILAGDFNMRHSPARFDQFRSVEKAELAREYCLRAQSNDPEAKCEILISFDGDHPWLDTQDLQFFHGGSEIGISPFKLEAWFDGPDSGGRLSDHDAYIVTYRLFENEDAKATIDQS